MIKKSKFIYIIGSAIIGVIALLIVFFALIASGVINVRQSKLVFSSATNSQFVYDGTSHTDKAWKLVEGELRKGHEAVVTVSGSQTEAGSSENYISAKILDAGGADVTADYQIEYQPGVLSVQQREISIISAYAEKGYDGTPLICTQLEVTDGSLVSGQKIEAQFSGSVTNAGSAVNYYTVHITNSRGLDKTANYKINYSYGILTVNPREITIASSGATKIYDGEPLTSVESSLTAGTLVEGHECLVEVSGSRTNAGTGKNEFSVTVVDADGKDVTLNYEITKTEGDLVVTKRDLIISTDGAEKEYDGLPLSCEGYKVGNGLLEGHECVVAVNGYRINAGTGKNTFTATVTADGEDVSFNYNVIMNEGDLTVTPRVVTIQSVTAHKTYDGTPLTASGWIYATEKAVLDGHALSAEAASSIIDAGKCPNVIPKENIAVTDENGDSVLSNYRIEVLEGTLTVTPLRITVISGEASKIYDGFPLTCGEYEVIYIDPSVNGHEVEVFITGTLTEVGQKDNFIAGVTVTDEYGGNVTLNYDISKQQGFLTVKGAGASDDNDFKEDDNQNGNLDDSGNFGGGQNGEPRPAVKITSDTSGTVYLRYKSFGDYAFQGFGNAAEYGQTFAVGINDYGYNYLTSVALSKNLRSSAHRAVIEVLGTDYYLPYYVALGSDGYDIQSSDVAYSGNYKDPYTVFYYTYDLTANGAVYNSLGAYTAEEAAYRSFVYGKYTAVPASTKNALESIIAQFDKNDPELIAKVARYVQNAAQYSLEYDTALDKEADVVVSFLTKYKQGVCRHYAGAATVIYRMLGVPARYVIGYKGQTVKDEEVIITTEEAHAWVEVYIDGMGWVQVEVTGGASGGGGGNGGETEKPLYVVKPENCYALYDGLSHAHSQKLQGVSKLLEDGYECVATISGSGISPGKYVCTIEDFKILYNGEDVTSEFVSLISFETGTLQIYLYELDVTTGGDNKEYDGTALENPSVKVSGSLINSVTGELTNGDKISQLFAYGSQTNAGDMINKSEIHITDADGNDVTDNYKINNDYGTLRVTAREITITAASAQKPFNGQPLTDGRWEITEGTLADGHTAEVTVSGTVSGIGTAENKIVSVTVYDANGVDVTTNYKFNLISGTLEITIPD